MGALSKLLFTRLPYNCYEACHTWNPNCDEVRLELFMSSYTSLLPLYLLLNSSSYLFRYKQVSYENLWPMIRDVFTRSHRSATALGIFFFAVPLIFCHVGRYLGYYNPLILYTGSFISAFLAGLVETDRRLQLYIVYMLQLVFEMFVALGRDYQIKGHPIITPLVFASSVAVHTYFSRTGDLSRTNFANFLMYIVGKENLTRAKNDTNNSVTSTGQSVRSKTEHSIPESRSDLCRHTDTCSSFMLKRSAIVFGCAAGASLGLRFLTSIPRMVTQVRKGEVVTSAIRAVLSQSSTTVAANLGLGLASACAAFNGTMCYLRQQQRRESVWHTIPSSFLAAFAMHLFWPSERIAIYALCNTLYALYMAGLKKKQIPSPPFGPQLAFAQICATLFAVGSLKPHYVRKSYVNFLNRLLGSRIHLVNWSAIAHMGFDSAKVYKDNFGYVLHPEYVSTRYMQTMWVWSLGDYLHKIYGKQFVRQ